MIRAVLIAATLLGLTACNATESQAPDSPNAQTKAAPPRPANGKDLPARSVFDAMPDYDGIGPLRFGMTAEQMRQTWGVPLYGEAPSNDRQSCYYLRPQENDYDLLFMVEGDRFVRLDVKTGGKIAPGGGRVGMDAQQIEKLYAGRVHVSPGKYDRAAKILDVTPPRIKDVGLIFETDASGVVKSWRIGISPQIDYVEGCG